MIRVETVFLSYKCPKMDEEVDIRVDRLRDTESQRVISQKFECDKAPECCLNSISAADQLSACPHPEAKRLAANQGASE